MANVLLGLLVLLAAALLRSWLGWMSRNRPARAAMVYRRLQSPSSSIAALTALGIALAGQASSLAARQLLSGYFIAVAIVALVEMIFVLWTSHGHEIPDLIAAARRSYAELVRVLLYLVVAYELARMTAGLDERALVITSTLLSLGLGAALKPALQNLVSGVVLRMSRPYQVGHLVEIGSHIGIVERLDWRSTSLTLIDAGQLTLPNAIIAQEVVVNYYLPTARHRHSVRLGLDPTIAPPRAREALLEAVRQLDPPVWPPFEALLSDFKPGSNIYEVSFWVPTALWLPSVEVTLRARLTCALDRLGWLSVGTTRAYLDGAQNPEATRI